MLLAGLADVFDAEVTLHPWVDLGARGCPCVGPHGEDVADPNVVQPQEEGEVDPMEHGVAVVGLAALVGPDGEAGLEEAAQVADGRVWEAFLKAAALLVCALGVQVVAVALDHGLLLPRDFDKSLLQLVHGEAEQLVDGGLVGEHCYHGPHAQREVEAKEVRVEPCVQA